METSEWQPIETAPKDGTRILLWAGAWRHPFVGFADSVTPYMVWLDIPTPQADMIQVFAAYWQPLPAPPKENNGNIK